MMDHFDFATASVSFARGAMMIGAHRIEIATLQNWKGGISISGSISGNAILGNAAGGEASNRLEGHLLCRLERDRGTVACKD